MQEMKMKMKMKINMNMKSIKEMIGFRRRGLETR